MDDNSDLPPANAIPSGREGSLGPERLREVVPGALWPALPAMAQLFAPSLVWAAASSVGTSTDTSSVAMKIVEEAEKAKEDTEAEPAPGSPKRLSDLIREDEERESAELRRDFSKLNQAFDSVHQHALAVELDVQSLTTALLDQRDYLDSMPTLKPTNGWYSSGFGLRNSPFTDKSTMHEGMDIANHVGSTIVATASGIVTYAGPRPGYGNLVTIDHGYGIQTQYGHISKSYVKTGEKVKRGQRIAAVGNTGRSTGPHVHYEVRVNGIPVDPYFYILED
jgi:murein DD-endopeptidase MepM/ murein hydrolase activator NlpD